MSTAYHVELTTRAARDLRALLISIQAHHSATAARWLNGLERAIKSLRQSPQRCPLAPESGARRTVHQLLYGRRPHVYRILFEVADSQGTVFVLHIRHGARRPDETRSG